VSVKIIDWISRNWSEIGKGFLLAFLIIVPTIAVFWKKSAAGAGVLAAVGAAALLLTRLPDISTFELLALKVKLDRQSQQVEVTLQQLQKMAAAFAQASLTELAMSGQMLFRTNTRQKFEIHEQIINSLKEIKISDDAILKAQGVWITVYCRMILDRIEGITTQLLPEVKAEDEIESLLKDAEHGLPLPNDVRNWIAAKSLKDPTLTQFIDEYENVWAIGTMKNPDLIPFNQSMKIRDKP
jgi:hypothetical protein